MTKQNLYVDVHVIQDVPPANLNRDDGGSPKSARYGGADRLRVSSQSWKRATRIEFEQRLQPASLGVRTRKVGKVLTESLVEAGLDDERATEVVPSILGELGLKENSKRKGETEYLLYFSRPQVEELSKAIMSNKDLIEDPKALMQAVDVKEILSNGHSLDVALFGRMVADIPEINVDAACQVAHAIATHAAPNQSDYYTAVDDESQEDESGAGMIGTLEFNSATLYRFATVSVPGLANNLGDDQDVAAGVTEFIESFVKSIPCGKQNSYAAHTRPALVLVTIRVDHPVSYVSAFENPVVTKGEGYLAPSLERFERFVSDESVRWGDKPIAAFATTAKHSEEPSTSLLCDALGAKLVTFGEMIGDLPGVIAEIDISHE